MLLKLPSKLLVVSGSTKYNQTQQPLIPLSSWKSKFPLLEFSKNILLNSKTITHIFATHRAFQKCPINPKNQQMFNKQKPQNNKKERRMMRKMNGKILRDSKWMIDRDLLYKTRYIYIY